MDLCFAVRLAQQAGTVKVGSLCLSYSDWNNREVAVTEGENRVSGIKDKELRMARK